MGPSTSSDICCTCTQSAIVSVLNVLCPRTPGSHGPCYWFTNACNPYVARLCPRHNAVEHFVNTVEAFPDIRHSATTLQAQESWRTSTGRRNSARLGNMVRCQTPYAHWCCLCLWKTALGRPPVKTELSICFWSRKLHPSY